MQKLTFLSFFLLASMLCHGQSVKKLQESYSGKTEWDKSTGTLRFTASGTLFFKNKTGTGKDLENDHKNHFWSVPKSVKKIFIAPNTKVTAAFHTYDDIEIVGENRKTSILFGTDLREWTDKNNPGGQDLKEWYYAQLQNFKGTMTVKNLTLLNPFSYFIRGYGAVVHVSDTDFIDNRGGHHNHSDGFSGGDGSTVTNCYFEAGDDVFKAYFDNTYTDCTIKMIDNSVPIQLGWGNYSDGAKVVFKNLKIIGDSGRTNADNAIISGRKGTYTVTVDIDGLEIENPNAVLVSLYDNTMTLNGRITNAKIEVKQYSDRRIGGTNNLTICGSKEQKNNYNCAE